MEKRYRLRSNDVTHERFDDELVIVDLETGSYYSAGGSAACAWQYLLAGASVGEIADALANGADVDAVERDMSEFVTELLNERLITDAESGAAAAAIDRSGVSYGKPVLTKYDDLQALLLVDPIHDVDEAGWPALKPAGTPL